MSIVKPFKGILPKNEIVEKVASLPYDVMNREEAKQMAGDNELTFLRVVRSEIDVEDSVDIHDESVYQTARKNLDAFIEDGVLVQDDKENFYIYRQIMKGRVQTGIVGCTSIDEYLNDNIKKHEYTRPEKELDRINNFDYCDANTAPIFLTYRKNDDINLIINNWIKFHDPMANFISEDEITHIIWKIDDQGIVSEISELFKKVEYLYIADGHHRSASSVKVGQKRRASNPNYDGSEEFNFFMSVIFPDEDLFIMDYNRAIKDLNGNDKETFMSKVSEKFEINEIGKEKYKPMERSKFGMFIDGCWYELVAKDGIYDKNDPVERLDVSILQNNLLNPILGIDDPRTNTRIDFIGGIRGLDELQQRVEGGMAVAFSMFPTTMDDLISIANAGQVMPPKSTWFEPKLRSGLFVHKLK